MSTLLDQALKVLHGLPADAQDDIARIVLHLARDQESEPVVLSPDEQTSVAVSKAAAARGKMAATDKPAWAKHRM
jgi:hypothetical protein